MPSNSSLIELQSQWTTLYRTTLPSLAKARSPVQSHWPVHLDHCFARIILDNAIGEGSKPWTSVLKAPAVRNMSQVQLISAITLGEEIVNGEKNLVELDRVSLMARGKQAMIERKGKKVVVTENKEGGENFTKRKRDSNAKDDGTISNYFLPSPKKSRHSPASISEESERDAKPSPASPAPQDLSPLHPAKKYTTASPTNADLSPDPLVLVAKSNLTPFRKIVLSLLCAVPKGHYTTYAAISTHISLTSSKSTCARAVGNALRNNPFAPLVPCHRVLASDGRIGGFGGDWGEEGRFAGEKVRLLRDEGVKFDGKGKVVGGVWMGWVKK